MKSLLFIFAFTLFALQASAQVGPVKNATTPPYPRNSMEDSLNNQPPGDALAHSHQSSSPTQNQVKGKVQKKDTQPSNYASPDTMTKHSSVRKSNLDGFTMTNGHVMIITNGEEVRLDHDMTMSNGTKISSDGSVRHKDGTGAKLREGQHMDASGVLTSAPNTKPLNPTSPPRGDLEQNFMKNPKQKPMDPMPGMMVRKDSLH